MWIKNNRTTTSRLYRDDIMDEPVEFNENGTAQVPKEVGESMIEYYNSIEKYEKTKTNEKDESKNDG